MADPARTSIVVPVAAVLPNASRTGPTVTVAVLRPSAVSVVRLAAIAIAPDGAAGSTTIGPALPEPPPARDAWIEVTVSATVSRANVWNTPATRGPDAGDQRTEPPDDMVIVALSVATGFPNASTARTITRTGCPAAHCVRSGSTRR